MATKIDLPWTYVGGSTKLINDLVSDSRFEAQFTFPDDSYALKLSPWLTELVEIATNEFLETRRFNQEVALGTVSVEFLGSEPSRHGAIVTTCRNFHSGSRKGKTSINELVGGKLREEVQFIVANAILELINYFANVTAEPPISTKLSAESPQAKLGS